jgi:hypothetical protein
MQQNPIDKSVHDIATSKAFKTVKDIWLWTVVAPIAFGIVLAIGAVCMLLVFLFLLLKAFGM